MSLLRAAARAATGLWLLVIATPGLLRAHPTDLAGQGRSEPLPRDHPRGRIQEADIELDRLNGTGMVLTPVSAAPRQHGWGASAREGVEYSTYAVTNTEDVGAHVCRVVQ